MSITVTLSARGLCCCYSEMNKEKGKKPRKIEPTEEGWTPEILLWFIAAIELALEKPENKEMVQRVREATEEYQLLPHSQYIE